MSPEREKLIQHVYAQAEHHIRTKLLFEGQDYVTVDVTRGNAFVSTATMTEASLWFVIVFGEQLGVLAYQIACEELVVQQEVVKSWWPQALVDRAERAAAGLRR